MATAELQTYVFKGKDRQGRPTQGQIRGPSLALVKAQLRKQGVNATSVKRKAKPLISGNKPVKAPDICVFTRQMATMMKAGVPLVQSFEIVAEGVEKDSMCDLINTIRDNVASGLSFGNSLRKHPEYFDDLFCSLVEAGENAGALETMLERIATYKEKTESLKAKVKKALTYPTAVLAIGFIVMAILLIKVIPQFASTFSNFGADLPAFTLFVLGMSDFTQAHWFKMLIALIAVVFIIRNLHQKSEGFATAVDRYSLKIPVVGNILYEGVVARFARTLSTTFAAGVPLVDALSSVAGAAGNAVYKEVILKVRDDVITGVQLNTALKNTEMFPAMLLQMALIGEESGALDGMLAKAADHYEESVDNRADNLTTLLEPMIMAVLGVLVGGMLIAMYLPIFQLGSVI